MYLGRGKTLVQSREETDSIVAIDGLTNIYNDGLTKCDTKNSANK